MFVVVATVALATEWIAARPAHQDYYATFFPDPDGLKLEFVHFPWGYWRRAQTGGMDERARYPRRLRRRNA